MSQLRVVGERTANWTLDVASANAEEDDKTAKGDAKRNGKAKQAASTVISSSAAPSAASGLYTLPSSSASRSTAASKRVPKERTRSAGNRRMYSGHSASDYGDDQDDKPDVELEAASSAMTASLASDICSSLLDSDDDDESTATLLGVSMSLQQRKLLVYRAILVSLELCYDPAAGTAHRTRLLTRPEHFPDHRLLLPESIIKCTALIKQYVFVCITDFLAFQRGRLSAADFEIFSSTAQLGRHIRKKHHFRKLSKAKQDLLNPLLRKIIYH